MSIAYPLSMPAGNPQAQSVVLTMNYAVAQSVSPFTSQEQVYEHLGTWWELDVNLPPMNRASAEKWIAFLGSLHGRAGTFLAGDPAATAPQGNPSAFTVNGAGQTGNSLIVNLTGTLKAGDYFSIGSGATQRLYKNLTDLTGAGTLDIFPRLRESPANSAPCTTASATGVFRLVSNAIPYSIDSAFFYGVSFKAREAY
jgi:hypothetical protein